MPARRDTPAMRQYAEFKRRHPECVLFFRMGDFYEMFDDDAELASRVLGLTLTQRSEGIPMAGLPYHQLDTYLRRMIDAGHRVAVCDQVQDASEAKGVVERAVTRVVTPGTLVEESLLRDDTPNTLASVCFLGSGDGPEVRVGGAAVELSTGAFTLFDCAAGELPDELARLAPSEALFADAGSGEAPRRVSRALEPLGIGATARPAWHFRAGDALEALLGQYGVRTLAGFGLRDDDPAVPAAGAIVRYLRETQALDLGDTPTSEGASSGSASATLARARTLAHLAPPRRDDPDRFLRIDGASLRALEVERTVRGDAEEGSLLGVFRKDACRTAMGKRLLREWLRRPLRDAGAVEARQACVATLVEDPVTARALGDALGGVQDVARIAARVSLGRATPRDLAGLGASLGRAGAVADALEGAPAFGEIVGRIAALRESLDPVAGEIASSCVERPPARLSEGGLVRDGVDAELDEARALRRDAGAWLAAYQARLAETHDLPNLKVGFNKVFGYYIELPRAQSKRAPEAFTRKQTLKNAERYITPELKDHEEKVLGAEDRALAREREVFQHLCSLVAARVGEAARYAEAVAELDALACFARVASRRGWTRPEVTEAPGLEIRQGRHPVLDEILGEDFVPNDCELGGPSGGGPALALITGPNMSGKSTFIRQVALLTLLAHTGSFVPAERAVVGLCDRIFTRVGADDALHRGQSTFMVEMVETANILHNAGPRSLVILDEIGRGTSTLDGLALARAIAEHLADAGARTLFATHYHELTDLADEASERVTNLHVSVREWGDEVVFLHRILPGRTDRSYGIHVARLAGLPDSAVRRARTLLESLAVSHAGPANGAARAPSPPPAQPGLFTEYLPHPVIEELKALDLDRLTPMDAFDALRGLRRAVEPEGND